MLVVIVMDYQNVHLTGAHLFRPHQPLHEWLVHPGKFANEWRKARLRATYAPFSAGDSVRFRVHVHRGLPDASLPGYARNMAQKAHWETATALTTEVRHRPLRYRKHYVSPGGWQIDPHSGREKGVDVAVALDLVNAATYADVVVLASVDTDLKPAVEYARTNGTAQVETTAWYDAGTNEGRRQLRVPGVWNTRMDEVSFVASIDPRQYP